MSVTWIKQVRALGHELSHGLLHLVYPGLCHVCAAPLPPEQVHFCARCRTALLTDPFPTCPRCAGTVGPFVHLEGGCTACRQETFHFERVVRLGPYESESTLRQVVLRLKHHTGEGLAELVGALWAEHAEPRLRALGADVIVPVPLHWWRRLQRGYNQSAALARGLAGRLHLPCRPRWLRRTRATPHQTSLSPTDRRQNVRDAFAARPHPALRGQTVLLVDDVLTTGTTASEAAKALRRAGAARVLVAVLARGQG